jgi:hypothetical protein
MRLAVATIDTCDIHNMRRVATFTLIALLGLEKCTVLGFSAATTNSRYDPEGHSTLGILL